MSGSMRRYGIRVCVVCDERYQATSPAQKMCSSACRRQRQSDRERSYETAAREFREARMIEVMRGEPTLENWQLEERFGVGERTVQRIRARAGIPHPTWAEGGRGDG